MHRLIVGAPFGNYLQFENTTPTLGTFTRHYRGGFWKRLWRVLLTVRYYHGIRAWKNRLRLPNPGIDSLGKSIHESKIISIAGFNTAEWEDLMVKAMSHLPEAVELNASCPNCPGDDQTDYAVMLPRLVVAANELSAKSELILKLPPVGHMKLIRLAVDAGITSFHCCNTMSTPGGGLSGKPLKLFSLQVIADLYDYCVARNYQLGRVIGGGGVSTLPDAMDFIHAGATNVSVASALFFPWKWPTVKAIARTLEPPLKLHEPVNS